jgi:hypothetical protein
MVFIRTASSRRSQKYQKKIGKTQNRIFGPFWGRRCWLALSLFFFLKKGRKNVGFFFAFL